MESAAFPVRPLSISSPNPRLHRRFPPPPQTLRSASSFANPRCFGFFEAPRSGGPFPISTARNLLLAPPPAEPASRALACLLSSAGSSGGGDGLGAGDGGSGGDDGGSGGGETAVKSLAGESDAVSALESDVIVLSVGGMSCGGCTASVKRILESQPQVSSATVNLEKETAVVWVVPEVKATQNWQCQLGEKLANHLTTCGFKSNLQGKGHAIKGEIQS